MKSRSRHLLSGGIVCVLVAFGLVNAGSALLKAVPPAHPIALHSTQQIVDSPDMTTAVASTMPR